MNAFIAASDDQPVIVQNVLRCSRSSLAARLPSAFAACRPARSAWIKNKERNRHDRTRRRVIDTNGIRRGSPLQFTIVCCTSTLFPSGAAAVRTGSLRERLVDQRGKPGADVTAV